MPISCAAAAALVMTCRCGRGSCTRRFCAKTTAGSAALRKELLEIAQRDTRLGCHVARAKVRIGKAVLDDRADTAKLFVCVKRNRLWIGRRKYFSDEIVDCQLHVDACSIRGSLILELIENELKEKASRARSTAADGATQRFQA